MIYIAICDDMPQELERANALLLKYASGHRRREIKIQLFSSPLELLSHVTEKGGFDVLLLDVYMPGIMGTEVARELRALGDTCQIIFLTTSRDHAVDAFSLNATHYLVKPYSDQEFDIAMVKVMDLFEKDKVHLTIKSTDGINRVDLNELIYAETDNHIQKLYLSDGKTLKVRKSSTELYELLEGQPNFYKCGSSFIINMDYIVELSSKGVTFSTGNKIPIPIRKYAELKKIYMDYSCMG